MFGKLFSKSSFGLEISNGTLKFIELISNKNGFKLGRYGERPILLDAKLGGIKNFRQVDEFFSIFKQKEKIKMVHLSLPDGEIKNKEQYLSFFNRSGLKIKSFESSGQAIKRAVVKNGDMRTYMIVSSDKDKSNIWITSKGVLTHSITISSNVHFLHDEVAKSFLNWHLYKNKEGVKNPSIEKIILCGDGSDLVQLAEYLSVNLRHKVELANVWVNILDTKEHIPEISFKQSLSFAATIGAALKGF